MRSTTMATSTVSRIAMKKYIIVWPLYLHEDAGKLCFKGQNPHRGWERLVQKSFGNFDENDRGKDVL